MKYSDVDIYVRQGTNTGVPGHRPGRGVFSLFITAAIVLVIVVVIFVIPPLLSSKDVSYSGLGISYRFQSRGDWIYYAEYNFSEYPGTLWRISSDGEEKKKIIESDVDLFALYGDQILYITHTDNDEWILHTVDTDGNDDKILYQSNEDSSHIIKMEAASGQCYVLDTDNRLHIIELNNGEVRESNDDLTDFCIEHGWIYYIKAKPNSDEELFQLWRIDLSGTINEQLMKSFEIAIDYSDNKIYYIMKKMVIYIQLIFLGRKSRRS